MNGPTPFSSYCVISTAHLAQPCAQAPQYQRLPAMGVRERTAVLLFLIWPMRIEALQRKAHECDSSKDTLGSHGIPLRA